MEKYNGWSNYATWRINLVWFDGYETDCTNVNDLADELKSMTESYFDEYPDGYVKEYALAFISDVNWYEIAEHILEG